MKNILVVNSSINGEQGNSNKLVQDFLRQLNDGESVAIETLDLSKRNIGHLSAEEMQSWMTAPEARTDKQSALASLSDEFVAQIQNADVIVLGVPKYTQITSRYCFRAITALSVQGACEKECRLPFKHMQHSNGSAV